MKIRLIGVCVAGLLCLSACPAKAAQPPSLDVLHKSIEVHDWVTSVVFSPDGKTLAFSDFGEEVQVWDIATGKKRTGLPGHAKFSKTVAVSPDGKLVATGDMDGQVRLWDAASCELKTKFATEKWPTAVAFSPDGKTLATGGTTLQLWDVATSKKKFNSEETGIHTLVFHPDGKVLAAGSPFEGVTLYDAMTGQTIATLSMKDTREIPEVRPMKGTHTTSFSPDGKLLATIANDMTIRVWNWSARREVARLGGPTQDFQAIAFSPDGAFLASASLDKTVVTTELWDVKTWQKVVTSQPHEFSIDCLAFSPDGKLLTTAGPHTLRFWELSGAQPATSSAPIVLPHDSRVTTIQYSADGKMIATQTDQFRLWEAATGKLISTVPPPNTSSRSFHLRAISFRFLALETVQSGDPEDYHVISLFDLKTNGISASLSSERPVPKIQFDPEGKRVATATYKGTTQLFDTDTGKERATLMKVPDKSFEPLPAITFSPDGTIIAGTSLNGSFTLWDAKTGLLKSTIDAKESSISRLVFSPDGKLLAADPMGKVKIWDVATGKLRLTLERRTPSSVGPASGLAFSPDGKTLASASWGKTVNLWDVATPNHLPVTFTAHQSEVASLAFSPDGKFLATGGEDSVKIWKVGVRGQAKGPNVPD